MPREIDERKKNKALNRIRRAKEAAERAIETSEDPAAAAAARTALSEWEEEFVASVEERLTTFGSAFADPEKGQLAEPLSRLQEVKLREIEQKAKGKDVKPWERKGLRSKGSSFKPKSTPSRARSRDINADIIAPVASDPRSPTAVEAEPGRPAPRPLSEQAAPKPPSRPRPAFRVIEGGKQDE